MRSYGGGPFKSSFGNRTKENNDNYSNFSEKQEYEDIFKRTQEEFFKNNSTFKEYAYKKTDPFTGKTTYFYQKTTKGNPFYNDFSEFMGQNGGKAKFGKDYYERNREYYSSFKEQGEPVRPEYNNQYDPEFASIVMRQYVKYVLVAFTFFFFLSTLQRRRRDEIMEQRYANLDDPLLRHRNAPYGFERSNYNGYQNVNPYDQAQVKFK